jgi:predicted kinase
MNDALYETVYQAHMDYLKHLDVAHKKLFLCFSAVPGTGKTTIAKVIEQRYKAVRIRTDTVRDIISTLSSYHSTLSAIEIEAIVHDYLFRFLQEYKGLNNFLILDASVDRRYKKLFPLLTQLAFPFFVTRIIASREHIEKRIKLRDHASASYFLENLDVWFKDFENFAHAYDVDIILNNDKDLDLRNLFEKLDLLVQP